MYLNSNTPRSLGFMIDKIETRPLEINENAEKLKRSKSSDVGEISIRKITKSTVPENISDFVALDVETTGIRISGNRIIEVSAIRFEDFYPVEAVTTLVNPKMHIPEEATAVNNITDEMVVDAPQFYQIADSLRDFIGKLPIVAHNAAFDIKHLAASGLDLRKNKIYCTLQIAKSVLEVYNERKADSSYYRDKEYDWDVENCKLETLCKYYGVQLDNAHRALEDSLAAGFLFWCLADEKLDELDKRMYNEIAATEPIKKPVKIEEKPIESNTVVYRGGYAVPQSSVTSSSNQAATDLMSFSKSIEKPIESNTVVYRGGYAVSQSNVTHSKTPQLSEAEKEKAIKNIKQFSIVRYLSLAVMVLGLIISSVNIAACCVFVTLAVVLFTVASVNIKKNEDKFRH